MTCRSLRLILTLALSLLVAPLTAVALPGNPPRIGVLALGHSPTAPDWKARSPFEQELRTLGWLEGHNIILEYRWAEWQADRLPPLADELVHLPVDVIVVSGALLLPAALLFTRNLRQLVALARQYRLPAIFWNKSFAEAGGLLAYGPSQTEVYRRLAVYVDKILKGVKPADLPMERPMHFELVLNLKTAQALGLTIPPSLLFQTTEVIR